MSSRRREDATVTVHDGRGHLHEPEIVALDDPLRLVKRNSQNTWDLAERAVRVDQGVAIAHAATLKYDSTDGHLNFNRTSAERVSVIGRTRSNWSLNCV